jgi:predicted chitinase
MSITAKQVRSIAATLGSKPRGDLVDAIVQGWPEAAGMAKLTTRKRAAAFLGQIMTETGGLQILVESGAYRFETICKVFGEPGISAKYGGRGHSAHVTEAEARQIAALPIPQRGPVLFDRVYGPGNPKKAREFNNRNPGDGWRYRGGGMMQTTGKSNYADKAKKTGLPLVEHPELLQTPGPAFKAAYLEWGQDGRANATADAIDPENPATIAANRKVINGGTNGLAEFKKYYARAVDVLAAYDGTISSVEVRRAEPREPEPAIEDAPPNVQPIDEPGAIGDPILFNVQRRLKERRFPPGKIDGRWGGGISGALSSFRNDRGMTFAMPSSLETFHEVADEVRAELTRAENEVQPDGSIGWFRPVSEERANADPAIIKELAPETVPVKRNFFATISAFIATTAAAIWNTISGYVSAAYNFFTDHQDVIDDHPGIVSKVWEHVTSLPTGVWLALAAAGIGYVALNSWLAIKTSTKAVTTGERQ